MQTDANWMNMAQTTRMVWAFRDAAKDADDSVMVAVANRVMRAVFAHRAPAPTDWQDVVDFNDAAA